MTEEGPLTTGRRRSKRLRRLLIGGALAFTLAAGGGAAYEYGLFSDIGDPVSFGKVQESAAAAEVIRPG